MRAHERLTALGSALTRARALQTRVPGEHPGLRLQRLVGNTAVLRARAMREGGPVSDDVEHRIDAARPAGRPLDAVMRADMEQAFGTDFTGVRVNTSREAANLSHELSARAFTTGADLFFADGEYAPGTSGGRELLAHELTHVVQQTGSVQAKLTVAGADDPAEREAEEVARAVVLRQDGTNVTDDDNRDMGEGS